MGLAKKKALVQKKGRATFSKAKEFKAKGKSKQKPSKVEKGKKRKQFKKKKDLPISHKLNAIKITGLPYDVTDKEIRDWFKDSEAQLDNLRRCDSDNWKSGMAYGTVSSDEALQKAVQLDNKELKGRFIRVMIKQKQEIRSVMQCAAVLDCFVILRGLPFDCKKREIAEFFKGLSIVENGICFERKGTAFVRFVDSATAKEALKRNDNYIRDRYIKVFFCKLQNLTELTWFLSRQGGDASKSVINALMKPLQVQQGQAKSKPSEAKVKQAKKKSKKKESQLEAEIEEAEDEMMDESDEASDEEDILSSGEDEEDDEEDSDDESMEEAEENLESSRAAAAKKKKGAMGSSGRGSYLASKGFAVAKSNGSFTEIVKKNSSAKKNGDKRTPAVMGMSRKDSDSDEEMIPQLIPLSPKQMKVSTSPKKSKKTPMKKKGKRRSGFTVTPK